MIPRLLRTGAASTALVLVAACATAPAIVVSEPRELAGAWRGRLTGRSGSAIASFAIKEDGGFAGTMYFDGEDKEFSGAITVLRPGEVFYRSSQGFGRVVLLDRGGARTLIFRPDGGGVASVFTSVPEQDAPGREPAR